MLGLIIFILKICFAAILGGLINYTPGSREDHPKIIESSLICIMSCSILALSVQITKIENINIIGFGILSLSLFIIYISKNKDFFEKIIIYLTSISGIILGCGFFVQATILIVFIYIILHNGKTLLNYVDRDMEQSDDKMIKKIIK